MKNTSNIFFLVLRRMRLPLIVLVTVYSIATIGMTLIPGITPDGEPWRMSFFHAFYFVSYMGTTIGFGEIPYAFTDAQRSWVLLCVYTTVISWLYGIGSVLKLVQDETFLYALQRRNFQRSIARIDTPFYIICGYGETGEMINRGLCNMLMQTVIIDRNPERIASLELGDFLPPPITLAADITDPNNLIYAGINNELCKGVIAVTNNDHTNLQVAVAAKLVNDSIKVINRSEIEDEAKNMASFGTDIIINPYLIFAQRLKLLADKPELYKIQSWFVNQYSAERLSPEIENSGLPGEHWIVCGYGRLGKAIHSAVSEHVKKITIITPDPIACRAPDGSVIGRGTEADTLHEAGIETADVIIAASEDDANNLSIIMTARQIKPSIITIARASNEANKILFKHADCHYIMRRSLVVANQALTSISRPLVSKFIKFSSSLTEREVTDLASHIKRLTKGHEPITWRLIVDTQHSPDLVDFMVKNDPISIGRLCYNREMPESTCIPLLLMRDGVSHIMPADEETMIEGDQLLVCGPRGQTLLPQRLQHNTELLDTIINDNRHYIPLFRWLGRRKVKIKPS